MREIKFRFWDTYNRIWLDPSLFSVSSDGKVQNNGSNGSVGGVLIEQFTGLKDKNGVDIYEGDIIKHPNASQPEDLGFTVLWKWAGFYMRCNRLVNGSEAVIPTQDLTVFEIIGNIHDNPELLK